MDRFFILVLIFSWLPGSSAKAQEAEESIRPRAYLKSLEILESSEIDPFPEQVNIQNFYKHIREDTIIETSSDRHEGMKRRIPWLYPGEGCEYRAEMVNRELEKISGKKMQKVFVLDPMKFPTRWSQNGFVIWFYHVAPIAEIDGQMMIFDVAVSPEEPMTLKDWVRQMSYFMTRVERLQVAVCDSNSFNPKTQCRNGQGVNQEVLNSLEKEYLLEEWKNIGYLGFDPQAVLTEEYPLLF